MVIPVDTKTKQPEFAYLSYQAKGHTVGVKTPEQEAIPRTPLIQISSENVSPEEKGKVDTVNTMHRSAYGITLLYDHVTQKILKKPRANKPSIYTSVQALTDLTTFYDYSSPVQQLAVNYSSKEPTETLVTATEEVNKAIYRQILNKEPEKQIKEVDTNLGIDRFLDSEVDTIELAAHDIRNSLSAIHLMLEYEAKQGSSSPDISETVKQLVSQSKDKGEITRKHLAALMHLEHFDRAKFIDSLRTYSVRRGVHDWNVIFPDMPQGFPYVLFNKQRLESLFDNALTNAEKARRLLEEKFLLTAFSSGSTEHASQVMRFLQRLEERAEGPDTLEVAIGQSTLRRREYMEVMFRDNGIGNDHVNARREWRRNFAIGDSAWASSDVITGTGIAMGKHRQLVKDTFSPSHADLFLRNRSDGKQGAELVLRIPIIPFSF